MSEYDLQRKTNNARRSKDSGFRLGPLYQDEIFFNLHHSRPLSWQRIKVDSPHSHAEKEAEKFASTYSNGAGNVDADSTTASSGPSITATVHASGNEGGFALNEAQVRHVESAMNSGGSPLPISQRRSLEHSLGQDLNQVRIHTGDVAEKAAASIHARAFTVGNDIVFGKGEYRPGTKDGDHLLAHEMAHVAQGSEGIHRQEVDNSTNPAGELSGIIWVTRFPTSNDIASLIGSFRISIENFINSLSNAGANVEIEATYRPPERAYLMHYAFRIARENFDPRQVPANENVNINWWHGNLLASKEAAEQMVQTYSIVYRPALQSNHTMGRAIDMEVTWNGTLSLRNAQGDLVNIISEPRNNNNTILRDVARTFGVIKHLTDYPHWSHNGM